MIVNGVQTDMLAATQRATQYGDGCFTTARVTPSGQIMLFAQHLARLQRDCQRLHIAFTDWPSLQHDMQQQAALKPDSVLKVLISRGQGGRGYGVAGVTQPSWLVSSHPLPSHYVHWRQQGITLMLSSVHLARQPLLAGIKHLNRLEQVLSKVELEQQKAFDDALLCDSEGMLIEATAANLFWCIAGQWYTPQLAYCGVEGVMRQHLLSLMPSLGHKVKQVLHRPQVLTDASDVFLSNCLMGIMPVASVSLADRCAPTTFINQQSRALMAQLEKI